MVGTSAHPTGIPADLRNFWSICGKRKLRCPDACPPRITP